MCAISLGQRHLVNAYKVKVGWLIPFMEKRVGGGPLLTHAIPERIGGVCIMCYTLYFTYLRYLCRIQEDNDGI